MRCALAVVFIMVWIAPSALAQTGAARRSEAGIQLAQAYTDYIYVKRCHDRQQSPAIDITFDEIERARRAIMKIETMILQVDSSLDRGAIWEAATGDDADLQANDERYDALMMLALKGSSDRCRHVLRKLEATAAKLRLQVRRAAKDF